MAHSSYENGNNTEDVRQIPKWTRKYAMNRRAIRVALFMVMFLGLYGVIGGLSHFAGVAYRAENTVLFLFLVIPAELVCVAVVVGSIYFSVPKWGGAKLERFLDRMSDEEGVANLVPPSDMNKNAWVLWPTAILYASCILASVYLGIRGSISIEHMQPVSALYVVPFLLFLSYKLWPIAGPIPLIWPVLYALHAILILAGAPILFTGAWTALNMLIPIAGYGLLASTIGYAYSRYALRRLRSLARIQPEADDVN